MPSAGRDQLIESLRRSTTARRGRGVDSSGRILPVVPTPRAAERRALNRGTRAEVAAYEVICGREAAAQAKVWLAPLGAGEANRVMGKLLRRPAWVMRI